jgi:acetyl esterase/lipase
MAKPATWRPSNVVVAGSSAGGNLAATAALTPNDPRFQHALQNGVTRAVTAGVVLYAYYGNYHRGDSGQASSPLAYIRADAPPFFIAHGDRDMLVPVSTAREFVHRLRAVSTSPVVYTELPGAQHTFDLYRSIRFTHVVDGIETFADWTRTAEP